MARKIRSLKGEEVDFDLLKTKQELGEKDRVLEVRDREDFVHTKRRTRGRAALLQRLNKSKASRTDDHTTKTEADTSLPKTTTPSKKRKIVKKD